LAGLTRLVAASDSLQSVTLEGNIDIDNLFSRAGFTSDKIAFSCSLFTRAFLHNQAQQFPHTVRGLF
jgi:hypothetical protein